MLFFSERLGGGGGVGVFFFLGVGGGGCVCFGLGMVSFDAMPVNPTPPPKALVSLVFFRFSIFPGPWV